MSKALILVGLSMVLAVLKAVVIALVLALPLALLFAFITRPGGTLVFLGCMGLLGLAAAQPLAFLITLGVLGVAVVVMGAKRKPPEQALLTDSREHHSD